LHTNVLGLEEHSFWKSNPKKLSMLYKIYKKVNGLEDEELENIDNILF